MKNYFTNGKASIQFPTREDFKVGPGDLICRCHLCGMMYSGKCYCLDKLSPEERALEQLKHIDDLDSVDDVIGVCRTQKTVCNSDSTDTYIEIELITEERDYYHAT